MTFALGAPLLVAFLLLFPSAASANLFWTTGVPETIGRAELNGSGVEWEFVEQVGNAWSLDVDSNHIYWANRGRRRSAAPTSTAPEST